MSFGNKVGVAAGFVLLALIAFSLLFNVGDGGGLAGLR